MTINDNNNGGLVVKVVGKKKFDPEGFGRALSSAAGVFTAKNHPEWRTKKDVIKWLEESRAHEERTF